jgi:hypothetical protein
MTLPPMDQARRQALAMAQAKADPNASFAERVAQFDQLAQISQKRKERKKRQPFLCSTVRSFSSLYV